MLGNDILSYNFVDGYMILIKLVEYSGLRGTSVRRFGNRHFGE